MALKLETKPLFHRLIKAIKPDLVCDVGSMDASDARRFRKLLPHVQIIAFEGNPDNIALLKQDENLKKERIELRETIVGNHDGKQKFYIENLAEGRGVDDIRRGISSTRIRSLNSLGHTEVEVASMRLDTFIQGLERVPDSVALWIDVEGAAYEVLEGIEGVCDRIKLIHVEVETEAFWEGQRLKADVEDLMRSMGFITLARGRFEPQHDLVMVNDNALSKAPFRFKWRLYADWILTNRLKIFSGSTYS